jgi:hypothetical protein
MSTEQITNIIAEATKHELEAPRPLRRALRPADPYPVGALGELLGGAAQAIQGKIQAPIEICAQSVFAAATLAVQGHVDVQLPFGQTRPTSCFFITIADSGERKSSCDQEALRPFEEKEERMLRVYGKQRLEYENKRAAWEKERSRITNSKKKQSVEEVAEQLNVLGGEPVPPLEPLLTCPEPTYEGICRQLKLGEPTLGVFADEGGQFASGHAMQQDNRTKTAAAFCNLWDGKPVKRVRAGDGTTVLLGRRVSAHFMMQHSVANTLLADSGLLDQGLLSRFLVCAPESTIGSRFSKKMSAQAVQVLESYNRELTRILDHPLPIKEGTQNELNPRVLMFSDDASRLWTGFHDEAERKMGAGGEYEQIKGFANKMPEQAARMAGVLVLVENINAQMIEERHIRSGILLASYYAGEALRLNEHGYADPDVVKAERLYDWLTNSWGQDIVSAPDIYQNLNFIRDKNTAKRIIAVLVDHGWLDPVDGGATINGQRRREVWRIIHED